MEVKNIITKYCPKCRGEKDTEDFWRDKTKAGGRCTYCIACSTLYRQENPDIGQRGMQVFSKRHPEYMSQYCKAYREKNPNYTADRLRVWRRENRKKYNEYMRIWMERNKMKIKNFINQ